MANRLAGATSPYLQAHANQPVDWRPWGEEAWAEARRRDVPVFVSLGYAACHWCHVMADETFADREIAAALNEGFVCIKVDREEHPDVDAVYMATTQAFTGSGGWPNSVFCTPAGEPFFAGTYFPRVAQGGMPGFDDVVAALADAWASRRDEVLATAGANTGSLRGLQGVPAGSDRGLHDTRQAVADAFDPLHGGFGGAPKFPPAMVIDALLVAGEPSELAMAQHTLEAMARGGIHDQLAGGFHRYATDAAWVLPHFEKMLYDNALLLGAYARGWRRTPDHDTYQRAMFAAAARGIVGWLERELRTEQGLFAASLDADSADAHGRSHEGVYYLWNPELLADALGEEDAHWAAGVFHVTRSGTAEHGLSTLLLHGHPDAERLASVRQRLLAERDRRFRPERDDKIVAAWQGWLIDALVTAGMIFGEPGWLELARTAAHALWRIHWDGNGLARTSRDGSAGARGACEDYAGVALGLARLAGATGEREPLERAVTLLEAAETRFAAPGGGWFDAEPDGDLYARPRDVADSATPSATTTMVKALRLVGLLAERDDLLARADAGAATQRGWVAQAPVSAGWALEERMIDDEARRGLKRATVVVVTPDGDPMAELARAAWRMAPAGSAILTVAGGAKWGTLADERPVQGGTATAYVCRGTVCFAPAATIDALRERLWTRC